jgi:prepilin-type N-terminal cleavage/methylation domain-containing protein
MKVCGMKPVGTPCLTLSRFRPYGFSLLELTVVLFIIGLLAVMVAGGMRMFKNLEVNAITQDVADINKAVKRFQQLYNGLPGDLYNADSALPSCGTSACANGDGDGQIETSNASGVNETRLFWQHLSAAKMIPGRFDGASDIPGSGVPVSVLGEGMGYAVAPGAGDDIMLKLSAYTTTAGLNEGALTPEDAMRLDRKHDDGNPLTGTIRAEDGPVAASCVSGNDYNFANQQPTCELFISLGFKAATGNAVASLGKQDDRADGGGAVTCEKDGTTYPVGHILSGVGPDFPPCPADTTSGGNGRLRCQPNGAWAADFSTCTLNRCPTYSAPNAVVQCPSGGTTPAMGETCVVSCSGGAVGKSVNITCRNPAAPAATAYSMSGNVSCVATSCSVSAIPGLATGMYPVTGGISTVSTGNSITIDCDYPNGYDFPNGWTAPPAQMTCNNGNWSGTLPLCIPIGKCTSNFIPGYNATTMWIGWVASSGQTLYDNGDTLFVDCNYPGGYDGTGQTITCNSGSWSGSLPTCNPI